MSLWALLTVVTGAGAQCYSGHVESSDTNNSIAFSESVKAVQDSESRLVQISDLSRLSRIENNGVCNPASCTTLKNIYCDLSTMNQDLNVARSALRIAEADFRGEPIPEKQEIVNLTQRYYYLCVRSYETAQSLLAGSILTKQSI
jgi:hypothetical protein